MNELVEQLQELSVGPVLGSMVIHTPRSLVNLSDCPSVPLG